MALFGERCIRCGVRTKNDYHGTATCPECVAQVELSLQADQETMLVCPIDGAPMSKEISHSIIIDRCTKCRGVWLDPGELEQIKVGVRQEQIDVSFLLDVIDPVKSAY